MGRAAERGRSNGLTDVTRRDPGCGRCVAGMVSSRFRCVADDGWPPPALGAFGRSSSASTTPWAKRSGPQCETVSAARWPIERAVLGRERGHPGQLARHRLDIERVESAAGGTVGLRHERGGTAGAVRDQQRQAAGGGFIDDEPPGLERLGSTNAPAWAYHRGKSVGLEEPGPVDCRALQPLRAIASSTSARAGPSPQRTRSQAVLGSHLTAVACECLDQPDQVLLGHEPADRQKIGGRRQTRAALGVLHARDVAWLAKIGVVDGVVAQGDPAGGHAELHQVIAMRRAADECRVEQRSRCFLISSFHQTRGRSIAWLSDIRIAGRPRRRAHRAAAIDSGRA